MISVICITRQYYFYNDRLNNFKLIIIQYLRWNFFSKNFHWSAAL